MERIAGLFLELGYRRLPKISVNSIDDISGFIDLYKYPVLIVSGNLQVVVKEKKGLEPFENIPLDSVTVEKYFKNSVYLKIEYHSEYNIVSIDMKKGGKSFNMKLNPLVSLTSYKVKTTIPEMGEFADQICDSYNLFLDNNYKIISSELFKEKDSTYFSLKRLKTKKRRRYDDIMIAYNVRTVGEYINDIFKRYGKHAYMVPIEKINDDKDKYSHIFVVIVNDRESLTDRYVSIISNAVSEGKRIYCMYEGISDKEVKGKLMRNNIIFMNDPYDFIKMVVMGGHESS